MAAFQVYRVRHTIMPISDLFVEAPGRVVDGVIKTGRRV